jgi:UDP-2,3-diacylglucosamine pyrophosphatase LpxH
MNDKIFGRPIRCNQRILNVKSGKQYAELLLLGDVHWGSPQCDTKRFLAQLDYCLKNGIYVHLMGDLIEMATKSSVGAGVYEQESIGQSQFEQMEKFLTPLAKKGLLTGLHNGNHEDRCYQLSGVNVSKAMANELDVPYLSDACWNTFKVGPQNYAVYSLHGRTGARFDGSALLAIERISTSFSADIVAMGHCHKLANSSVVVQRVVNGRVKEYKKHLILTGSYLKYDGGYAQTVGLPLSKLGSPKVKIWASTHDIHVSV